MAGGHRPGSSQGGEQDQLRSEVEAIVESSADAIYSYGLDGQIRSWNNGARRLLGYRPEEAIGMSLFALAVPGGEGELKELLERLRTGERIERLEVQKRSKGGRSVDVAVSAAPILDREGHVLAACSVARDISDRKRLARLTAARHEASGVLFDNRIDVETAASMLPPLASTGIWSAAALWWVESEQLFRCAAVWTLPAADLEPPFERGAHCPPSGEPSQPRWLLRGPEVSTGLCGGVPPGFATSVWVPIAADGPPVGAFQFLDRRTQARDEQHLDMLVSVASRLAAALEARRSRDRLEAAKDELLATVSHELRTPLTSIIGYGEMLAETEGGRLSEQGRSFLEAINRNAEREMGLVSDLLVLSSIQIGTFAFDLAPVELERVVGDSVAAARPEAERHGLELLVDGSPVAPLEGDALRLGQVVDNLISNAIKFSPDGGRITARYFGTGSGAVVEVSDQGIGIAEAEQRHLFERLYRAPEASSRRIAGLGLGLSIVAAIVNAHGGAVSVESELGEGSTFRVELPLVQGKGPERPGS